MLCLSSGYRTGQAKILLEVGLVRQVQVSRQLCESLNTNLKTKVSWRYWQARFPAMFFTILVGLAVFVLAVLYLQLKRNRDHIENLGFPVDQPNFVLGSSPLRLHKYVLHEVQMEKMRRFGKTYVRFEMAQPVLVTIDPDLIKAITITHFENFSDIIDFKINPKVSTLDFTGGEMWHVLRKNMSPTFTSGKLRGLLEPMSDIANDMITFLDERTEESPEIDVKKMFQNLTLETISQCAFGIKSNAFYDQHSDLLKHGQDAFSGFVMHNALETFIFSGLLHFPALFHYVEFFPAAYYKLYDVTESIMKARMEQGIKKADFIARMQELIDEVLENPDSKAAKLLTKEHITAQGAIFFLAGFETTASTLATLCYNLANHPEIQDRLRAEINTVIDEHDGRIDYDSVHHMKYLEACINENLRLIPPVYFHLRQCTKDTEIKPGLIIKKGVRVDFPIYTSHHNPEFFPDPEKFNPDRFLPENEKYIQPLTFRPFGGGPRLCIGQRFALIEMKIALAKLLSHYQVSPSAKTKLEFEKGNTFMLSYPELKLNLTRL
ncbi:probable cytochrome P450 6a18 [Tigriopus californicus]|uniref:probable cytochrome P450 6a18 n=1 Tax=Tigriopus californicus TaxID=6832 RepID=UPI0027DA72E4|nr:probable cytochrome P450 6a18 [Tigriopus californicus]